MLVLSCDKSPDLSDTNLVLECSDFEDALLDLDKDVLEAMLNPELKKLKFLDSDNNSCLHDSNLDAFAELINETCSELEASVICCGCIETFPLTSEVRILIDSASMEVQRIIDVHAPDDGVILEFKDVHF